MISANASITEQVKFVKILPAIVPSSTTPAYVSLKGYHRATFLIHQKTTTTVTGSAITLTQATNTGAAGAKAVAFTTAYRNLNTGNSDLLSSFAVSSNTFTTDNTNSLNTMYVIDVQDTDLDINNGFDCLSVGTGNAVNATIDVYAVLYPAKFGKNQPTPSAIVD